MKFLAVPSLEKLSALLSSVDLGDRIISCKVEAYSCKQAGDDKKFSKALERQISEEYFPNQPPALNAQHSSGGAPAASSSASAASLSASHAAASSSSSMASSYVHFHSPVSSPMVPSPITPLGPISESSTRKLLISLIQTMNAALSDYDFSQVRPEQFTRERAPQKVKDSVNNLFLSAVDQVSGGGIREEFWQAVNDCIDCEKCEIYSFSPDADSDLGDDKLWCVLYFFFNKKAKKILFLGAEAANKLCVDSAASSMAEIPAPSKAGKHAGLKRAIDRSNRTSNSTAMSEGMSDESQSKGSDAIASSTDDDTENDLDEDAQQSKRRRRQKNRDDSMDDEVDDDSDDGGSSVSASDVYTFDPDSDEQLAQIRQAAALEASEAKVSGSPLNMPLRAPQTGLVFSSLSSSAGESASGHHAPRFSFTTSALSPYIAAVGFQPTDAKLMPTLTLQPPAKTPMM